MNILLIEDSTPFFEFVEELLCEIGNSDLKLKRADRLATGLSLLHKEDADLVMLDLGLPDSQGLTTVTKLLAKHPEAACLVLTGRQEVSLGVDAVKAGALDFLYKGDINAESLARSIYHAIERKRARDALLKQVQLANLTADVSRIITQPGSVHDMLQQCAEAIALLPEISLARVRTYNRSSHALELQANAGLPAYADSTPPEYSGCLFDIRQITASPAPHISFNLLEDPYFLARGWANENNIVAAAVYPLHLEDESLGALSIFSSQPLAENVLLSLSSIASSLTVGIQRKETELRLLENEARNRAIIESALDSIVTIDQAGTVIEFNPAAEKTFRHKRQDVVGRDISQIIVPERFRASHKAGLSRYAETKESHILGKRLEFSAVRSDGEEFPMELTVIEVLPEPQLTFAAFIRDLSEQKKNAENSKRLLLLEQREDFMATLTHDLKNPLIGASRILTLFLEGRLGELTSQQSELISQLLGSNKRLLTMINKLLEVYRYDKSIDPFFLEPSDLTRIVQACIDDMHPLASSHDIKLRARLPETVPVHVDQSAIRRVVLNLLDNAIKFTPDGGLIQVSLARTGSVASLSVKDNGRGIPLTDQEKLFQRFWHGGEGSRYEPGTGLGLYLCKLLVTAHGGSISCTSTEGKGSTFTVKLPADNQ